MYVEQLKTLQTISVVVVYWRVYDIALDVVRYIPN